MVSRWVSMPHNAVAEARAGHSLWTVGEQLLAIVIDAVNQQTWVMQKLQTKKTVPRPKPFPRPWDEKPSTFGKGAIPYDEVDAWIASTIREE